MVRIVYVVDTLGEGIVFLWRNRRLFNNEIVYVFWTWSFGHTIGGLDYASRLYHPHRISLIYLPHQTSNRYLAFCFAHNMDVFEYHSHLLSQSEVYDHLKRDTLRFLLLILSGLTGRFQVIEHLNIYKTLSLAGDKLLVGNDEKGCLEKQSDWTGYIRLLRENIGHRPELPMELNRQCREAISRRYPSFFEKPFVSLLLREKGGGLAFSCVFRCSGPHENYLPLVHYLAAQGFHVVGTGETRHTAFRSEPSYFALKDTDLPDRLLNLFILMNSAFFIGQQSGPHVLLNSCGIPCLMTDAVPYRIGTFRREDIVLFKHLYEKRTGRPISLVKAFRRHLDLVYGYNFDKQEIDVLPNTPDELLAAGQEMVALIRGKMSYSEEDMALMSAFRCLPTPQMGLYYHGNRTSIHILRQLKSELLGEQQYDQQPNAETISR